ncbi:MAG: PA14 domain-containing protein [Myxococcota bacterium]
MTIMLLTLFACQDYTIRDPPKVPVAPPPDDPGTQNGEPPNWNDCFQGFLGEYSNLPITHPDVEPDPLVPEPDFDVATLDWWSNPSFQQFSPSLDFGSNWWPVDEGLEGDPAYFTVRWVAWLRAWDDTTMEFSLGSADDVWILLDDEVIFAQPGIKDFEPQTYTLQLDAGQYPLEIRYAHRAGQNGFRFRVTSERGPPNGVSICYAEYDDGTEE